MRHFENIAYSVIFGDTVYCLKKEQLARIPKLGFQSVTDSVLESIWMDCNYFLDTPLRSATAASMGQKGTIGQNYKDRIPVCNGICFGIHLDGLQLDGFL